MKILFLAMTLALFASCNNSSDQDAEMSDTTTVSPNSDMSTAPLPDTTQSSMGDTSTYGGAANDSIGK